MDIYKVSRILADNCPGFVDSAEHFLAEIGLDWSQPQFKKLSYTGSTRFESIKILVKEWLVAQPEEANVPNLIRILVKIKFCLDQAPSPGIVEGMENLKIVEGLCVICEKSTDLKCVGCSKGGVPPAQIPFYCGKEHQTEHWKGGHKKSCGNSQGQSKFPDVVGLLQELEKTYKRLAPTDILEEEDLQVVAEILCDDLESWRLVMTSMGIDPDKYDEWESTSCTNPYLIALKTLMEWQETEKTMEKLLKVLNSYVVDDLENLLQFGFSHIQPRRDPCTKPQKFKKGSIITGMKRNLSQEELERVVSINFEVPYADLDIMDEILDCGKLVEKSVKTIFLQVQDWDEDEREQCSNIYKMLMNPEHKILPYIFCGEGDDNLERIIVTVELKADNRLQGFGSDLLPRKRRNVYVSV